MEGEIILDRGKIRLRCVHLPYQCCSSMNPSCPKMVA
jgi:hypothetical protein